ncbi:hypothetical protein ACLMJK_000626 [Lecanora helva]
MSTDPPPRKRMFSDFAIATITNDPDLRDVQLGLETGNVLALNDACAKAGEDRFFFFAHPYENGKAPSLFTTEWGYGPLLAYEKITWTEEEKEEYWKHDEPQRYCLLQSELSWVRLQDEIMPMLYFIHEEGPKHVSWPNDTIAKAFLGIIDNEIHLARRVEWEHVALICGNRCELSFDEEDDPPYDVKEYPQGSPYKAARNTLTARGKSLLQCFKDVSEPWVQREWVPWSKMKERLFAQEDGISFENEVSRLALEDHGGLIKDWSSTERAPKEVESQPGKKPEEESGSQNEPEAERAS